MGYALGLRPVLLRRARLAILLAALFVAWVLTLPSVRAQSVEPRVAARLVLGATEAAPGATVAVGLAIDPGPGWHIYWQNPGESGYAPRVDWHLPSGFQTAPIAFPAPERLVLGGMAMNVHSGETILLGRVTVPAAARAGTRLNLAASIDLLVCSDSMCVPHPVSVSSPLRIGVDRPDPAGASQLDAAARRLPHELAGTIPYQSSAEGFDFNLAVPAPGPGESITAFPVQAGSGALGPARFAAGSPARLTVATGSFKPGATLDMVITYGKPGQRPTQAYLLHAARAAPSAAGTTPWLVLGAVGGAILGGLLLNLMPCVFPILSLKAMTLIRAGHDQRQARNEAIGYLAGAVAAMLALGGIVLALRAGGQAVGWAFQLQNPVVVALLLLLAVAMAGNLAGLYEMPTLALRGRPREGFWGGAGTGALAAFVATPCTGPFMASALGTALILPPPLALAVFAGLGLGLALPFLAIALWEPARRRLPRPGTWMQRLRHLLSLPMFATAWGLAWLLGQQQGVAGMALGLAGSLALGLGLWWMGLRQRAGLNATPALVAATVLAVAALVGAARVTPSAAEAPGGGTVPYSAQRLAALRAAHRPVLLYATAQWCLTCKVNEASSLSPAPVRAELRRAGIVLMEADWTRNDPQITRLLTANGRAGVPLYLWFPAGAPQQVLPQILTPGLVTGLAAGH